VRVVGLTCVHSSFAGPEVTAPGSCLTCPVRQKVHAANTACTRKASEAHWACSSVRVHLQGTGGRWNLVVAHQKLLGRIRVRIDGVTAGGSFTREWELNDPRINQASTLAPVHVVAVDDDRADDLDVYINGVQASPVTASTVGSRV
jgi:hypothetical protein